MKRNFVIIYWAIVAACQQEFDDEHSHPGGTDNAKTFADIYNGGYMAATCAWYIYGDTSIIDEELNCQFPPENENSTMFKYCIFSIYEEEGPECVDGRLGDYLVTDKQYEIWGKCEQLNNNKQTCCSASKTERPTACLGLTSCYQYCALGCTDLCPLKNISAKVEERSHVSKTHKIKKRRHGESKKASWKV